MHTVWAQRREAILNDCLVSPDVFHQMVDRLAKFVVPYQQVLDTTWQVIVLPGEIDEDTDSKRGEPQTRMPRMLPIVGGPETIRRGLAPYRDVFCRDAGFEHISRYMTGLLLSPNKTWQGLYDVQVWPGDHTPSRRAMHAAVFEAGWDAAALMPHHRAVIAHEHRGRGREVLSLDWTYAHHERGPKIWAINKAWDHVEKRMALYQTVVTAVIANRACLDGVEVVVQQPNVCEEEIAYLRETVQDS